VQAANGNFYGITQEGGSNGDGTVFEITPAGKLTTLYNFCSQTNCTDGRLPQILMQAANGNFYGTTQAGGIGNGAYGTVFEITPAGALNTLYSFCSLANCSDGETPTAGLVQTANGNLYGTAKRGGVHSDGTVFELTPAGQLTTLYNFCSQTDCADGSLPDVGMVLGTDGNFYGATFYGGVSNYGTVFEITPQGTLTTLYSLCSQPNCTDGATPVGEVQATNGTFYGAAQDGGGKYADGTLFTLSMGLAPFVEMIPSSGKVGAKVTILGNSLAGATSVTFNGTAATFTVVSDTEISAMVPAGATSGKVEVVISGSTLDSNVAFRVTK
jgi:uncharacterized repeat protein (TIGR03803 family)